MSSSWIAPWFYDAPPLRTADHREHTNQGRWSKTRRYTGARSHLHPSSLSRGQTIDQGRANGEVRETLLDLCANDSAQATSVTFSSDIASWLPQLLLSVGAIVITVFAVRVLRRFFERDASKRSLYLFQALRLSAIAIGLIVAVVLLPIGSTLRDQLLTLTGLILGGLFALASSTAVTNIVGGFVLRGMGNFRPGDFVRTGAHFGRVSEIGLFHVEIQTEDRDLTTIPNGDLASKPFTVIHSSGTIISSTVSLGYDVSHEHVEPLLVQAAQEAGLNDAFVQVRELGDYSVGYRVAGFFPEVRYLLTARSNLNKSILKTLHGADIEIMSPAFMNQRRVEPNESVIPPPMLASLSAQTSNNDNRASPEALIFDKAEKAATITRLRDRYAEVKAEIKAMEAALPSVADTERDGFEQELMRRRARANVLATLVSNKEDDSKG